MHSLRPLLCFAAFAGLGGAATAAAEPYTFDPGAAGLNGASFTADTLVLSDYAQIMFGNRGLSFVDSGLLPVLGFSLAGLPVAAPGYLTPGGWGAYFRYTGTGTQTLSPMGIPETATFQTLDYELIGYNGLATFGFAADGSAVVGGAPMGMTTLERGSLIGGRLAFTPGLAGPTIIGTSSTTLTEVQPAFIRGTPGQLDVTFIHPPGEYAFTSPASLRIAGGQLSSAVVRPGAAVEVPEPASAALLGAGVLGLAALRRRKGAVVAFGAGRDARCV